jgi:hypothetical protein
MDRTDEMANRKCDNGATEPDGTVSVLTSDVKKQLAIDATKPSSRRHDRQHHSRQVLRVDKLRRYTFRNEADLDLEVSEIGLASTIPLPISSARICLKS